MTNNKFWNLYARGEHRRQETIIAVSRAASTVFADAAEPNTVSKRSRTWHMPGGAIAALDP